MDVAATNALRGTPFPKGRSSNPSGPRLLRERTETLFQEMLRELGELSPIDAIFVRQACLLLAKSQRASGKQDIDAQIRMSGEARRIIAAVRKSAPKPDEREDHLAAYLAAQYGNADERFVGGEQTSDDPPEATETAAQRAEAHPTMGVAPSDEERRYGRRSGNAGHRKTRERP